MTIQPHFAQQHRRPNMYTELPHNSYRNSSYHLLKLQSTFQMMKMMMSALQQMMGAWNQFGGGGGHQFPAEQPVIYGLPLKQMENNPQETSKGTETRGRDRTTNSPVARSRQLPDGTYVDPLGRQGIPIKDANGQLLYVRTSSNEELRSYEGQSRKILSGWDPKNLPGEPLLGRRQDTNYVEWADKYFPGGFRQYQHNRSNSRTGVEDHEQLRKQLALSRGIPEEQVDYREVMFLYGSGGSVIGKAKSRATASIWKKNPPGTPSNPIDSLKHYRRADWEALWDLAPETKPKDWTWPADWKPAGRA